MHAAVFERIVILAELKADFDNRRTLLGIASAFQA